jgi:hypothetical protein
MWGHAQFNYTSLQRILSLQTSRSPTPENSTEDTLRVVVKLAFVDSCWVYPDRRRIRRRQMRMDIRSRVTWLGQFFQIGRIFADWANFCRLGEFSPYWAIVDCRFWTFFWKVTEVTKIIGPLFPPYKFCIYFYRKWVWPHFRRLFGKLIRPPCSGVVAGIYTIIYKDGIFSYIWVWQGWDTILIKTLPPSQWRLHPSMWLHDNPSNEHPSNENSSSENSSKTDSSNEDS